MPTIASENLKNIRQGMDVFVHVQQLQNTALTVTSTNNAIADLTSLQTSEIDLRTLTDLQGEGFPLDGSCVVYDSSQSATVDGGKVGIRSNIGTAMTVTVSASTTINALTLRCYGNGTITANSTSYDVREFVVIPVNATNITMTVTPSSGERIIIEDITPGITLDFDNDNLVSCTLDLESDLGITDASWRISSIEVQGYYPDDISEAVSNMGDGVPIIYYAGYQGDYSTPRYFYVSEAVTQENNLITIKGEDSSARLDNCTQAEAVWQTTRKNARYDIYKKLVMLVKDAKINVVSMEAFPPAVGTSTEKSTVVLKEATYREHVQYLMDITNKNGFYPRFIDAGIPTLRWSTPTARWDIYKADIGSFRKDVDRNINKIYGDDAEKPLVCLLSVDSKRTTIANESVKKGKTKTINFEDYYNSIVWEKVGRLVSQTLHSLKVKSDVTTTEEKVRVQSGWTKKSKRFKKGQNIQLVQTNIRNVKKTKSKDYITVTWEEPKFVTKTVAHPTLKVTGYKITQNSGNDVTNTVTSNRLGVTKEYKSFWWGRFKSNYNNDAVTYFIPKYEDFFNKSNIGGSFTYKGNPHMQPRDVFRLYELDGQAYTTCTIESIETTHEDGGMISTIKYREGVY